LFKADEPHNARPPKTFRKKQKNALSPFHCDALKLYVFLELTMAREEQKCTAWEAIRIVRERV